MRSLTSESFPLSGRQLIEASAGTGKTYTITNLYLRLILGHGTSPLSTREILLLTFTNAATDELRQRIRDRIILARKVFAGEESEKNDDFIQYLFEQSDDLSKDRKLLSAALQTLDEASVFTIHGFCARVLTEQSFETGSLFNQDLDADRDLLLQLAAEDCFRSYILTLDETRRGMALKIWRTPEVLLRKLKPYLFRHNLSIIPPAGLIDDEFSNLINDNRQAKEIWLSEGISQLLQQCSFNGTSKTVRRLQQMNDNCMKEDFDPGLWEPYHREALFKAEKKTTVQPKHPVFELIDSIWQRQDLVAQVEHNLWHEVFNTISENLLGYKAQFGQMTLDDLLSRVHEAVTSSESKGLLTEQLRGRWPVAMIDEFQDTDDLQYEIFRQIYPDQKESSTSTAEKPAGLFFIGDPKQAIYQFRGADIYTYINAKRNIESEIFSLTTNWRSTKALIDAVNHLFQQQNIFGNDDDIPFEPASVAERNRNNAFTIHNQTAKPISLFSIQHQDSLKVPIRLQAMEYAAEQTAYLLNAASTGNVLVGDESLVAGQIAFLVRERKDAVSARQALARRNIRSVYVTLESVLLTDTADDLKLILQAVIDPTKERAIKAALATQLMQIPVSEIDALSHDIITQQKALQEFQYYHHLWATVDIAAMIGHLIVRRKIAEKWFLQQDGERQITNLRHLAELLQTRSTVAPGMHRLIKWFSREKQAAETVAVEERQLRLESDQHLVQIVTMHAAKGLEYDVVMIPMAGFGERKPNQNDPYLFHKAGDNQQFTTYLDIASNPENRQSHIDEESHEEMRLLYVAITRARYKCFIGVPLFKNIQNTALAKLLHFSDTHDQSEIPNQLDQLPSELFDINAATTEKVTNYTPATPESPLAQPKTEPVIEAPWSMQSYSSIARRIETNEEHTTNTDTEPGFSDDDRGSTSAIASKNPTRFSFPRGPRVGVALHDLLEQLDFAAGRTEIEDQALQCLDKIGINDHKSWLTSLCEWLVDVLETTMDQDIDFCLAGITGQNRLNELEFHFPMRLKQEFLQELKTAGYLKADSKLSIGSLQGMMTGYIDLVVKHNDKYYLIDYKSNDLGPDNNAYGKEALSEAIKQHQYDLQYLIYTVALNRYLKQCDTSYDYRQHFGGVCYLFLRGMNGKTGNGVYVDHPAETLINSLDSLLQ